MRSDLPGSGELVMDSPNLFWPAAAGVAMVFVISAFVIWYAKRRNGEWRQPFSWFLVGVVVGSGMRPFAEWMAPLFH